MRSATSWTLPLRPTGMPATSSALRSPSSAPPVMSVSMRPGATLLTVMPYGPTSRASARAKPSCAALAAEYATPPKTPPPRSAATDHALHGATGDVVGAADVDREDAVPLLPAHLEEADRGGDACVVDDRSDGRCGALDGGQRGVDGGLVRDVATQAERLHVVGLGHLVRSLLGGGLVEVEDDDVPPGGGQGVCGGATDASLGGGAGDDCCAVGHGHGCSPVAGLRGWDKPQTVGGSGSALQALACAEEDAPASSARTLPTIASVDRP